MPISGNILNFAVDMRCEADTIKTMIRGYCRYLKLERGFSQNTIEAYEHDLASLLDYCQLMGKTPDQLLLADLEDFSSWLHCKKVAPSTQARVLCGVRSFYRFLVIDGYLKDDPSELLPSPDIGEHLPEVLTTEEIDLIEQSIDLSKPEGQRNRAIIETLFACGLRVSELVNLKISDIYEEQHFVRVLGKGSKERLVPIAESALKEIRLWYIDRNLMRIKAGNEDFVFLNRRGSHLTRTMILIMLKRQAAEAGIQKTISPHTLRHSFATELLKGGADLRVIQTLLGHENIGTTEIYTHLDTAQLREEILNHHPRNIKREES